jgi:AcrR family transcriptional regulator
MNVPARRRRSDATRAAIRTAARERFAADGYERATIRAIAADAGIDPAMVIRYFGTKERLFVAAAEFELRLPDVDSVPRDQVGMLLARHFLTHWEHDESLTALLRSAVTHPAAADRMREIFTGQVVGLAARLCPDPAQAPARAGLAASQILGAALCRFVLHLPPVVQMSRDELVHWLGGTLQHYLAAEAP